MYKGIRFVKLDINLRAYAVKQRQAMWRLSESGTKYYYVHRYLDNEIVNILAGEARTKSLDDAVF